MKAESVNQQKKRVKKNKPKWIQSPGIRAALCLTFLSGIFIVVSGTGAQVLFPTRDDVQRTPDKEKSKPRHLNFDIRLSGKHQVEDSLKKRSARVSKSDILETALTNKREIGAGFSRLKSRRPNVEMGSSALTGAVEIVRSSDGLTKASPGRSGIDIVRDFISGNQALYGLSKAETDDLNFIGESVASGSGIRMVRVEQMINDRPVFQSETRFILDREGRIIRSLGLMVPKAGLSAEPIDDLLSPQEALKLTMQQLDVSLEVGHMIVSETEEQGMLTEMRVADPQIRGKVTSKLVYFPLAPGVLIPAWSQIVFGEKEDWYVLVDARDGTMLWRKQIRDDVSTHDARFRVFVQSDGITPADNPAPQSPSAALPGGGTQYPGITPSIVSMFLAQSLIASPNGWINDCPGGICTENETQTIGNNVLACVDRTGGANANICDTDANGVLDGNGRPTGNPDANSRNRDFLGTSPRDFETGFLPAPQGGNPEAGQTATGTGAAFNSFRRGSVVQQFYGANWYHDKLHALGFDQAAGNFQQDNFGGGGLGNDRVLIDVQDGSGTNNANFSTPPDGTSGRAQMFRFTGPTIDRDGGLDAEILLHELTHGTSNRLVGNAAGLQWDIGGAMGEGWSDFYALSLLNNTNADDPNAAYANGAYATYKLVAGYLDTMSMAFGVFPIQPITPSIH